MPISTTRIDNILTNIFLKKYGSEFNTLNNKLVDITEKSLDNYFNNIIGFKLENEDVEKYLELNNIVYLPYLYLTSTKLFDEYKITRQAILYEIKYSNYNFRENMSIKFNRIQRIFSDNLILNKRYPTERNISNINIKDAFIRSEENIYILNEYLTFLINSSKDLISISKDIKSYKTLTSLLENNPEISYFIESLKEKIDKKEAVGTNENIKKLLDIKWCKSKTG